MDGNNLIIQINWIWFLGIVGTLIFIAWKASGRFTKIEISIEWLKEKIDILWKDKFAPAESPRNLNERGNAILNESGIKEIIDNKRNVLLALVRERRATNAYDAEQAILSVVSEMTNRFPELIPQLKDGSFRTGVDVGSLLFVGGIYLRDQIFTDFGFSKDDIDRRG